MWDDQVQPVGEAMMPHRAPARRSTLRTVLLVLLGLFLLSIVSCGGFLYWGYGRMQEAEWAATVFLEDLAAGRPDSAYDRTSAGFQAQAGRERFGDLLARCPELQRHSTRTREGWKVHSGPQGTMVILGYRLTDGDKTSMIQLTMIREGDWKVLNINVRL